MPETTCRSLPARPSISPHLTPPPPLLAPVGDARDLLEGLPGHGLAAVDGLEEEDVFLHIGRKPQQAQELRDAAGGHAVVAGRRGAALEVAAGDLGLDAVGEGEHLCDASWPPCGRRRRLRRLAGEPVGAAVAAAVAEEAAGDDDGAVLGADGGGLHVGGVGVGSSLQQQCPRSGKYLRYSTDEFRY